MSILEEFLLSISKENLHSKITQLFQHNIRAFSSAAAVILHDNYVDTKVHCQHQVLSSQQKRNSYKVPPIF
jgi:hypothetical protein